MRPISKKYPRELEDVVAISKPQVIRRVKNFVKSNVPVFIESKSAEHAKDLSQDIAESGNYKAIVSVGGDGLLNLIYSSLYESGNPYLPIMPWRGNSGNGAHDSIGIPKTNRDQLEFLVNAFSEKDSAENFKTMAQIITPCIMEITINEGEKKLYSQFFGMGVTGEVIDLREGMNDRVEEALLPRFVKDFFQGKTLQFPKYAIATAISHLRDHRFDVEFEYSDFDDELQHVKLDNCKEITIGNRITPGKGVYVLPNAKIDADYFDVMYLTMSNPEILRNMGAVLKGKKTDSPNLVRTCARDMTLRFPKGGPSIHYDGERFNKDELDSKDIYKIDVSYVLDAVSFIANPIYGNIDYMK
jgi:diacylglycerol kinase family enzyme